MKEKLCAIKKKVKQEDIGKNALFPVYSSDIDYLNQVKGGYEFLIKTEKKRNPRFHKLVFAMAKCIITNIAESHKLYSIVTRMQPYDLIKEIMFNAGMVEMKLRLSGDIYYEVKSIKFESMDQTEFEQVADVLMSKGCEILGIDIVDFRRNYQDYL